MRPSDPPNDLHPQPREAARKPTQGWLRPFGNLLRVAAVRWSEDQASRIAAALAFYGILAFAPLLLLVIAAGSRFLDSGTLRETALHSAREQLGGGAASLLENMIDQAARPGTGAIATLISVALALLAASGLFEQLTLAIDTIWNVSRPSRRPVRAFLGSKVLSVVMAFIFVSIFLIWVGVDSVVSFIQIRAGRVQVLLPWLSFLVSVTFLTGVFAVTFRTLPHRLVAWRDVWIGALIAAVGLSISKFILSLYFGLAGVGSAYGPAGAIIVILLWFYYSAQILLFGAEVVCVYCHSHGSRKSMA